MVIDEMMPALLENRLNRSEKAHINPCNNLINKAYPLAKIGRLVTRMLGLGLHVHDRDHNSFNLLNNSLSYNGP